jgi:hypothetical protein
MKDGTLAQTGTHETMKKKGEYAKLYEIQVSTIFEHNNGMLVPSFRPNSYEDFCPTMDADLMNGKARCGYIGDGRHERSEKLAWKIASTLLRS